MPRILPIHMCLMDDIMDGIEKGRCITILPTTPLTAALLALQDSLPLPLAISSTRWPPRCLLIARYTGLGRRDPNRRLNRHAALVVDGDSERRSRAPGDGGYAEGLKSGDCPCVNVDACAGVGRGVRRQSRGAGTGGRGKVAWGGGLLLLWLLLLYWVGRRGLVRRWRRDSAVNSHDSLGSIMGRLIEV
jgi:hypothetical protein